MSRTTATLLLVGNMVALPVLSLPAYGFIDYMNLKGISLFVLVAWLGVGAMASALWRHVGPSRLPVSFALAALGAYLPVVVAWSVALHPLLWSQGTPALWRSVWISTAVGGVFTAGYWLPASAVNCFVLRRTCRRARACT